MKESTQFFDPMQKSAFDNISYNTKSPQSFEFLSEEDDVWLILT